jgi:hypothetical protein
MATFWFMQKDERVKQYIGTQFRTTFQKAISCTFEGATESVSFFFPRITFANVRVYSQDNPGWSWSAKKFTVGCSWWHLIMYRTADLRVIIEDLDVKSDITQGKVAVADHMQKVFMGLKLGLPIELKSVTFKHAVCCLNDTENQMQARFAWQNELKKMQGRMKTSGYLLDGSLKVRDRIIFESLKGSLHADIGRPEDNDTTLSVDCSVELPYVPKAMRQTFVSGSWQGTSGTFSLKNVHEQVMIDPIQLFYDGTRSRCSIRGSVPLSSMWRFIHNDALKDELSGSCSLVCDMRYEDNECAVTGRVSVDNGAYKDQALGSGVITYARQHGEWKGAIKAQQKSQYAMKGTWQFKEATSSGSLKLANTDTIQLPQALRMLIKPGALQCNLNLDALGHVTGRYKTEITSLWNNTLLECAGKIAGDQTQLISSGTIQRNPYQCAVQLQPTMQLITFSYDDKQSGAPLVRVTADHLDQSVLQAVIGLPFIRTLSEQTYNKWPMHVEGSIAATIKQQQDGIDITMTTMDALMRVPETYNVMRNGTCGIHIDPNARVITMRDLALQFNEGSVAINRAVVHYDEDNKPIFMHVPILVDSLMLNMEQGLFAKISGYALLSKQQTQPTNIAANIIIDRAYIKENLLSGTFHKNLFRYTGGPFASYQADTTCDIRVTSRVPVRVKTPFLETAVRVNLQMKNSFKNPNVTGSIDLLSGFLAFPYRPLYITKGTIYFLPNQLHDPCIELVAKNKIKKYNVELQVSGSLQNHQIMLDASPTLTDEQIVALLLVGSEEESLNIVMPALIMQNLQTIVFGYDQSSSALDKVFNSLLQPFNRIHVVPSFSDKTGRGGLRGAIEIDVNDRWRALIQKNFSLTEDTRLEVEYLVSDDMSVRGVANERRDVGAEVEMKWKF